VIGASLTADGSRWARASRRYSRTTTSSQRAIATPIERDATPSATQTAARMASLPIAVRSTPRAAQSVFQRRAISDVAITRTGKPILRVQGGRSVALLYFLARISSNMCSLSSSLGGHTATVFGATGQLGRYIVNRLGARGLARGISEEHG